MAPKPTNTDPINEYAPQTAPRLTIAPAYTAPDGSVYVHQDLARVTEAWAVEGHIAPINRTEKFGDVESWAAYVSEFGGKGENVLLTWSERGLHAVMDYHHTDGTPARCTWVATHPFEHTPQWRAWRALADGRARSQKDALESLEDLAEDIVEPEAAAVVGILRSLRATVNATADTELRADGTTSVNFSRNSTVNAGKLELPPTIAIAVPVLKGHEVRDKATVRMRVSVDDQAKLTIRFSMPDADRVLERVYADRVKKAAELVGDAHTLLRSTGA